MPPSTSDPRSMNASDSSLYLDANLARLLAAYDQGIGEADGKADTVGLEQYSPLGNGDAGEQPVGELSRPALNEGSAGDLFPGLPHPQDPRHPGVAGPHRIGRFELRRQLGKGGCGIVFLAYDPKLKRDVALKLPRPEMLLSPDARRRLIREAHAAAEFDHPNLVPVYETGEIGPLCFIATAFCPGQTLADWLDRQAFPVPVRQAARLVAQIADAIQHAHDRGVLHRDMKPNNVILQETKADPNDVGPPPGSCLLCGEHFIPRVVDFGLAKLAERGPSETASRQILGTPKYMAPEQAQARHDDIGPQADVYALGVILYELLTGRAPYEGESDVEVLRRSIEGDLIPPRHLRADIPRDLEAICLKAMARLPAKRYRTAIDLADDLRRFLDGLPTLARPLNRLGRVARWLRRNDQVVALAVVTSIALFFLSVGLWMAYQSQLLRSDRDKLQGVQDGRVRLDRQRDYARNVRDAFLAWRSGDIRQMHDSLGAARMAATGNEELPEFTWSYLARLERFAPPAFSSPAGAVLSMAVSPNSNWVATGHRDGTLSLWDSRTGLVTGAVAHTSGIRHIAFIEGGDGLATAGTEPFIRTWTITADGRLQPRPSIAVAGPAVAALAASRDGAKLFVGMLDGECWHFSLPDQKLRKKWIATRGEPVISLAVSPGGDAVVTSGPEGPIRIWNLTDDEPAAEVTHAKGFHALATASAADGWRLITADRGGQIRLHDREGRQLAQWAADRDTPVDFAVSPDGSSIATFGQNQLLSVRETTTGSLRDRFFDPEGSVSVAGFGTRLYTISDDGVIRFRVYSTVPSGQTIRGVGGRFTAVALAEDGRHAIALADGAVESYARWGAQPVRVRATGSGPVRVLRYRSAGDLIGLELSGPNAAVWQLGGSPRIVDRVRSASGSTITAVDASEDGGVLALGDEQGRIHVWSIRDHKTIATIESGLAAPVRHLTITEDGRWLAAEIPDQAVGVWEIGRAERVYSLTGHGDRLWQVRFLPGSERLVTVGQGGSIRVWSTANGNEEAILLGQVGRVTSVTATEDGRTLATGSSSGEVKFWDLRTGQELIGLRRHTGPVDFLKFADSTNVLLSSGSTPGSGSELAWWEALRE